MKSLVLEPAEKFGVSHSQQLRLKAARPKIVIAMIKVRIMI